MKTTKTVLTLVAGLLLAASSARAQVEINISGAVAFRDTGYRATRALFGANLVSQNPADGPSTPTALKVTWTGTIPSLFGGQTVTVRAFYNGAVAGIQDLTQNRLVNFLASSTPGDTSTTNLQSDIAYSSVFQASTEFTTPVLQDSRFGATPITIVKSSSAPAALTNITTHQLKTLAANGSAPAWFFTGNTNDTNIIYFINRDPTAGQRVALFKESLFTGNPISYQWNTNTSQFVIDSTGRNAAQIVTHLNNYGPAISYLVTADSYTVNSGLNVINYNGARPFNGPFVNTSNDYAPLITGKYGLWVYEHLFNRSTASANVLAFRNALIAAIQTELLTSPNSIPLNRLRVERSADGAPVTPIE
jgi:hypothetical protein